MENSGGVAARRKPVPSLCHSDATATNAAAASHATPAVASGPSSTTKSAAPNCAPPLGNYDFADGGASYDAAVHFKQIVVCAAAECAKVERAFRLGGRRGLEAILLRRPLNALGLVSLIASSLVAYGGFYWVLQLRADVVTLKPELNLWGVLGDLGIGVTIILLAWIAIAGALVSFVGRLRRHRADETHHVVDALLKIFNAGLVASWNVELQKSLKGLGLGPTPGAAPVVSASAAYHAAWYWRLIDRFSATYRLAWQRFAFDFEMQAKVELETGWRANFVWAIGCLLTPVVCVSVLDLDFSAYADFYLLLGLSWTIWLGCRVLIKRELEKQRREALHHVEEALFGGHAPGPNGLSDRELDFARLDPFPIFIRRYRFSLQEQRTLP